MPVRCPSLIGRAAETRLLAEMVAAAAAGQGGAVFLTGGPGIGKSRLVREARAVAGSAGLTVVVGRAVESGTPTPLRPWLEAVLELTRSRPLPSRERLGPYAGVLGRLVPEWAPAAAPAEPAVAPLLGEGVLRLLRAAAPQGALLVLEDLHWADPETVAVLEYVCDHVDGEPVLVLGTSRDGPTGGVPAAVDALVARGSAGRVELAPLDAGEVALMVRACGVTDAGTAAAASEGVPLLVEELLGEAGSRVPGGLTESVGRRVGALGPDGARALRAAALLGRVDRALLAAATGLPDPQLAAALDAATATGLLAADASGPRFRHALTRAAVTATAPPGQRAALAAALLAALRAREPDLPGPATVLAADLAEHAGDPAAADLLALAGWRAARDGALDSAAALLARGLGLAGDAATRLRLTDGLADVRCRAGDYDAARAATRDVVALLRTAADPAVHRRAHLRLARTAAQAARWDDAEAELAAVVEPREQPDPQAQLVRALVLLGRHRFAEAAAAAEALVAPALGLGRPELACEALEVRGRALRTRDPDGALVVFEQARALAVRHDLPLAELSALHELGTIDMFSSGRRDRLLAARAGADAAGAVRLTAVLDLQLVAAHHMHGDRPAAQESAVRALEGATALRIEPLRVIALAVSACPAALTADRDVVEAAVAAIPPGALDGDPDSRSSVWGTSRATCSLLREDRAAAREELETAARIVDGAAEIRPQTWWGFWALLRAVEGRDARAAVAALRGCPAATNRQNLAYAELAEAVLAGRRGERERAAAAVAAWDAARLPWPWLRQLARRLVAEAALADGWGDPRSWLSEAAAFFDGFGAPAVAAAARELLAGSAPLPDDLRAVGVTPREAQVLGLLARGVTGTRELADQLVISPRTVEKHVEALCRKLGVRTRSTLAALAARRASGEPVRLRR